MTMNPAKFGHKIAGQSHVQRDNGKVTNALTMNRANVGNVTLGPPGVSRAVTRYKVVEALSYCDWRF